MSRPSVVLRGANIKVYLNEKVYNESQAVSYSIDYGEAEIYGIDSPFPQEIGSTRYSVQGSVKGVRIRNSGGILAFDAKAQVQNLVKSQYISIRITDRQSGEDILFLPNAKITNQSFQAVAKGVVSLSFNFKALVGFEALDRVT